MTQFAFTQDRPEGLHVEISDGYVTYYAALKSEDDADLALEEFRATYDFNGAEIGDPVMYAQVFQSAADVPVYI